MIRRAITSALVCLGLLLTTAPLTHAESGDLDQYKYRVTAFWWFSQPGGFFKGTAEDATAIDLHRDFGFGSYSTFSGAVDWRFKRKHHLLFTASPVESTKSATLNRTIMFQGETYDTGTRVSVDLRSFSFAPGYQWDFIRRDWGYVALATQINLLATKRPSPDR